MNTPADPQVRRGRSSGRLGAIAAYAGPVALVVAAIAAYLVPRPVTRWLGMHAEPPVVPDDLDNIVRILAVMIAMFGVFLAAIVVLVRWNRRRRAMTDAARHL